MSLVDVIHDDDFETGTFTVTRTTAGSFSKGRYSEGSESTFTIDASVQPMNGRELQALPEGQHADAVKKVYSDTELRTRTPTHDPDVVTIAGEDWEVFRVEHWEAFGDEFWKAYVARVSKP